MRKRIMFIAALLLGNAAIFAQEAPDVTVKWSKVENVSGDTVHVVLTGQIIDGWHIYDIDDKNNPTEISFENLKGCEILGETYSLDEPRLDDGLKVYEGTARFCRDLLITDNSYCADARVNWQACLPEGMCKMPEEFEFSVGSADAAASEEVIAPAEENKAGGSIWGLVIEAILWGLAMLVTPCVFPMIPMTVSFFLKGSSSAAAGRFKAFMYGLFIVLLYTVPISVIILITRLVGGDAVTADIFNFLATHWLPNIIFFVVFMVFAASFFGAFEITLPSSWANKSDANSDKKGLAGVFFMALTLVLVSFSCTGPIVGTVLIKSTQGEFWAPMVTMLAFSVAFALPFTIFALFPSLLKKMKSGNWLNTVKVVMGFIEVAFGFKFLSVADQAYNWHLLDREIYLAIWIVVFALLGLYLLGKIRFAHDDEPVEKLGVGRFTLAVIVLSFVVYMIPGMFGAPLKGLSGYLPPLQSQDFVLGANTVAAGPAVSGNVGSSKYSHLELPLGLHGYFTLDEGLAEAKRTG
ncbi:MAG: thiol:disulfide interchange protein, partial [Bacteroidales bacterium]|nr:thiol:disulfide interchange protein [Bacteroidales bacterium]